MSTHTKKSMEVPTPKLLPLGEKAPEEPVKSEEVRSPVLPLLFQKKNQAKTIPVNELVFSPCITKDLALLSKPGYLPNYENETDEENEGKGNGGGGT